jgi:hypothetical protein
MTPARHLNADQFDAPDTGWRLGTVWSAIARHHELAAAVAIVVIWVGFHIAVGRL